MKNLRDPSSFFVIPSPEEPSSQKVWKSHLISSSILCSSFYFLQLFSQRCFGILRIHGGLPSPFITTLGAVSTGTNLLLSQNIEYILRQKRKEFGLTDYLLPLPLAKSKKEERRDHIKRLFLSICSFVLLEQNSFRSAFPSSVISLGVFGKIGKRFRLSIPTDSAITTAAQREAIQKLGKRYGCHQCGSRQLLSRKVFIADHMPPTKIAETLSKVWWRKLFNRPVQQRLWPQCFKCYILQGHAVRNGVHVLRYHNLFRIFHFAPAVAYLLVQDKTINDHFDQVMDPVIDQVEKWIIQLEKALK